MEDIAIEKIIPRGSVAKLAQELHEDGRKIVFTNGCFDILHVGHIRYLQAARDLGDVLIMGVNTDDSVKKIKGPSRPIVPEHERAEMLAALECVSYVVLFHENTPEQIISEIKPDIHVKGGDYTIDQLPEAKIVQSYGGEVVIMPTVAGKSTTNIIKKISGLD